MKINGNSIRPGNIIQHKNRLWVAVKIQHTQPGKGGAYLQVELKDIRDGTKLNERFRSSETVERVRLDEKEYQFRINLNQIQNCAYFFLRNCFKNPYSACQTNPDFTCRT